MVYIYNEKGDVVSRRPLPDVFKVQIRPDVVKFVFKNMNKNKRQPYAVSSEAGHRRTAESWGTGRAVSRIPRITGRGSHICGHAAYGNMCCGGHMFAPTKIIRKFHVKTNQDMKRFASASAVAASAIAGLVFARGHRVDNVPQIPLVLSEKAKDSISKTSQAVSTLKALGAYDDVERAKESKTLRAGKGKMRNRRHTTRRGPLVVYKDDSPITQAFRNISGVDLLKVDSLNLLKLAPGGHVGRFIIWIEDAFEHLDHLFGTLDSASPLKSGFHLPRPLLKVADLPRILASDEVKAVLKPAGPSKTKRAFTQKKNPLRNRQIMVRLNPYAKIQIRNEILKEEQSAIAGADGKPAGAAGPKKKKPIKKSAKKSSAFVTTLLSDE